MKLLAAAAPASIGSPPTFGRPFWTTLGLLLPVNAAFVALHLLWSQQVTATLFGREVRFGDDRRMNIGQERGYAELWECGVGSTTVALFLACFMWRRQAAYLGLAVLFCLVVGDNLLQFHEKAGVALAQALGQAEMSPTRHAGEFGALLAMGAAGAGVFLVTYRMSDAATRRSAVVGLAIIGTLAFFAVGMDVAHAVASLTFDLPREFDDILTLVEDGGETIAVSVGLAFAWASFRSDVQLTERQRQAVRWWARWAFYMTVGVLAASALGAIAALWG